LVFQALAKKLLYPGLNATMKSCFGGTERMVLMREMWRFNFALSEKERGSAPWAYIFY
jgi:hypothetical protein